MEDPQKNIPPYLQLSEEELFCYLIFFAWLHAFPIELRDNARLRPPRILDPLNVVSHYGLIAGAYYGFLPMTSSYSRFIDEAKRVNNRREHDRASVFRKEAKQRENSAASEYGWSRGELKRFLGELDGMAAKFGFVSLSAVFNCRDDILADSSEFAPKDRLTYAEGPRFLWDFAKLANEKPLLDVAFDTFDGWVLFLRRDGMTVSGYAIHPLALRFGDCVLNPLIDHVELMNGDPGQRDVIHVPADVVTQLGLLAQRKYPGQVYVYMSPPQVCLGVVLPGQPSQINPMQMGGT